MPQVGQAWITVTPSLRGWNQQVRQQLKRELSGVKGTVPIEPDFEGIKQESTRKGEEAGGEFARSFKKRVEAALKSLPDVKIDADSTPAQREIAEIRRELQTLSEKTVGIDIDAGSATAKIDRLKSRLDQLAAQHPSIDLDVDIGAASAQLGAIERQVNRLDGRRASVNVDVDRDGNAQRASFFLTQQVNGLVLAGAGIAPVFVPAFAVAAAGALGFASALAGAGAGVGALTAVAIPAFSAVSDAVKATDQAEKAAATTAVNSSRQRVQAAQQAQQAAQRVADAQRSADRTAVEGARRVQDAQRTLGDTRRDVARRIEDANDKVEDSERALSRAHDNVRQAQEDLNDARRDAIRLLEDLREQSSDLALSEEGAEIALLRARQRQAEVNRDAAASSLDRREAALEVREAEDRLSDVQRDRRRTQQELTAAERAGVAGSELVINANGRLVDANDALADARRNNVSAQQDLARAEADGARAIADAERSLSDARVQAAQANADASRAVADALQAQAQQAALARLEAENGIAANRNLAFALAELTPLQRQLYDGWLRLRTAFTLWAASLEPAVIPLFIRGMGLIQRALPLLTPLVLAAAGAFNFLLDRASRALESPFWRSFFDFLARVAGPAIAGFGLILGNVAHGFAGILMAFEPFSRSLTSGLVDLSARFAEWGESLGSSDAFRSFIDYIRAVWPDLKETLKALGDAFVNIVNALAPLGGGFVLDAIRGIANWIADMDPETIRAIALALGGVALAMKLIGIAAAAAAIGPWGLAILGIGAALVFAYGKFEGFREIVQGVIDWVGEEVVPRLQAFGEAIVRLFEEEIRPRLEQFWAWFQAEMVPVLQDIGDTLLEVFRRIGEWLERNWPTIQNFIEGFVAFLKWAWDTIIFPVLEAFWTHLTEKVGPTLLWLWHNVVEPAWKAISAVISWAWNTIIGPVVRALAWFIENVLVPVFLWLWENVGPTWNLIATAIQLAWNHVIRPAFDAIRWFIREVLGPVFSWLWRNIIQPVWEAISTAISWAWRNVIKPIWDAINWFLRTVLVPVFIWLKDRVLAAWDRIKSGIQTAWGFIRDRILKPAKSFIETVVDKFIWMKDRIGDAFNAVKRVVSNIWERVTDITRGAVNTAIRIINKIGDAIEWVARKIGLDITIRDIPLLREPRSTGRPSGSSRATNQPGFHAMGTADIAKTGPFVTDGPRAIVGEGSRIHPEFVIPTDPQFRGRALNLFAQLGTQLMASGGTTRPRGPGIAGLYDPLAAAVSRIISQGDGAVRVVSGWRSSAQQARLYAAYQAGRGNLAAPPGRSKHEGGAAVDLGGSQSLYTRLARAAGLIAPVRGEPWHWEHPLQSLFGGGGGISLPDFGVGDAISRIRDAAKSIGSLGSKIFGLPKKALTWLKEKAIGWAKDKVTGWLSALGDVPGARTIAGTSAGAVERRYNQQLGQRLAGDRGWTGGQWTALNNLVMSESGWDNNADNPTSTAYGIGQFLDSTWAGTGYRKTSDARTQILAMLTYISQRYGNPAAAWAFKQRNNYYEMGGVLPFLGSYQTGVDRVPHDGLAFLHRDEAVLDHSDAAMFRQAALGTVKGGRTYEQHNEYYGIVDYDEIARRTGDDLAWLATVGSH